ncbi:hypothetical protein MKZ38_000076 [Zalerion maritima]|uniref:Uncharacterized protein n=1 Tax=Zalerion maritima TaxID=339359 RepID=A0AAD5S033_9PEZI|nr:hypothetical protein MKZ38_000076 [Zalerion maritima]
MMHILSPISHLLAVLSMVSSALAGRKILYPLEMAGLEPAIAEENGYEIVAVTEHEWRKMSPGHFASFDAIIIGDPFCKSEMPTFIKETTDSWGPAVTGNIMISGNSPSAVAQRKVKAAEEFVASALNFVANIQGATGLYFSLSCYYKEHVGQPRIVEELSFFGSFTAYSNNGKKAPSVHLEASHPSLEGLSEDVLGGWENASDDVSARDAYFNKYPDSGVLGFEALAIRPTSEDHPMAMRFRDGVFGLPYILTRAATPQLCGDGSVQKVWKEERDEGSQRKGQPDSLCNRSSKCKFGVAPTAEARIVTTTDENGLPLVTEEPDEIVQVEILRISTSRLPEPTDETVGIEIVEYAGVVKSTNADDGKSTSIPFRK